MFVKQSAFDWTPCVAKGPPKSLPSLKGFSVGRGDVRRLRRHGQAREVCRPVERRERYRPLQVRRVEAVQVVLMAGGNVVQQVAVAAGEGDGLAGPGQIDQPACPRVLVYKE